MPYIPPPPPEARAALAAYLEWLYDRHIKKKAPAERQADAEPNATVTPIIADKHD